MQAPPEDLPAAHSMDTEWFAIDGHGHVAVFDSGEAGGVPHAHFGAWHAQSIWEELLEEMLAAAAPGQLRFVADGIFEPSNDFFAQPDGLAEAHAWPLSTLFELDRPREQSWLDARLDSAYLLGGPTPLVYARECVPEVLASAWDELGIVRVQLSPELTPARFGLYAYEALDYSGGPYERIAAPMGARLRVESLATGVRRRLGQVRLAGVDFRERVAIQPFEHLPSSIWGSVWIGTDGSVHEAD
ncbi:MAG: hypothetical protein R6X02_25420 [Enhygromyxa sp.]